MKSSRRDFGTVNMELDLKMEYVTMYVLFRSKCLLNWNDENTRQNDTKYAVLQSVALNMLFPSMSIFDFHPSRMSGFLEVM
jgi:hypothetical protein